VEIPCSRDAAGLARFLTAHGLESRVKSTEDHCELEVGYAVEPEQRLRQEFEAALASWLATIERPLVPTADRERGYVLRPPGD
jgi:hypothetical protein